MLKKQRMSIGNHKRGSRMAENMENPRQQREAANSSKPNSIPTGGGVEAEDALTKKDTQPWQQTGYSSRKGSPHLTQALNTIQGFCETVTAPVWMASLSEERHSVAPIIS
jgi:hypothetical protein